MSLCQKGAPSDTSSVCRLALILMITCLFHCSAYLKEETLKMNKKNSCEQAEYQRTHQKDEKYSFFTQNGHQKVGHFSMIS